jgi:acetyltransferase-like isoleucine patch superfamily enzyme
MRSDSEIAPSAIVHPNVRLGAGSVVGAFVIVGEPARGARGGEHEVLLGSGACLRSHTVVYAPNRIGERFQTGHGVLVREENEIGDDVSIGSGSVVEHHVRIGHRVRLHSNVFVPEFSVLEDECWLGPNVVLTNARYPTSPRAKSELKGPIVEARARVGANATLLPGVRIGREALVGAGAVVTRDVAPGSVVVGNPARVVNRIERLPY